MNCLRMASGVLSKGTQVINRTCLARPLAFSVGVATCKTLLADVLVQRGLEKKSFEEMDKSRIFAFGLFGLTYMGCFQYTLYSKVFPHVLARFGKMPKLKKAWAQVLMDHTHATLLYIPFFYVLQSSVYEKSIGSEVVQKGLKNLRRNWFEDARNMSYIYIPAQFVNFYFVPVHFRVCFVSAVSLGWCSLLSFLRGSGHEIRSVDDLRKFVVRYQSETRWTSVDTPFGFMDLKCTGTTVKDELQIDTTATSYWFESGCQDEYSLVSSADGRRTPKSKFGMPSPSSGWWAGGGERDFEDAFKVEHGEEGEAEWVVRGPQPLAPAAGHAEEPDDDSAEQFYTPVDPEAVYARRTRWTSVVTDYGLMNIKISGMANPGFRFGREPSDLLVVLGDNPTLPLLCEEKSEESRSPEKSKQECSPIGYEFDSRTLETAWAKVPTDYGIFDLKMSGLVCAEERRS